MLPRKPVGEDPSLTVLASGRGHQSLVFHGLQLHLCLFCHMMFSLCVCVSVQISLLLYDTSHIGVRAHPTDLILT